MRIPRWDGVRGGEGYSILGLLGVLLQGQCRGDTSTRRCHKSRALLQIAAANFCTLHPACHPCPRHSSFSELEDHFRYDSCIAAGENSIVRCFHRAADPDQARAPPVQPHTDTPTHGHSRHYDGVSAQVTLLDSVRRDSSPYWNQDPDISVVGRPVM